MVSLTAIKSVAFILQTSFYEFQNCLALRCAFDCSLCIYPIHVFVHFCLTIMYNVENYLEKRDVIIILRLNYFSENQSENKNMVTSTSI